jgi:hypothetical protein
VYVIGEEGIQQELDLKGIKHSGGPADADKRVNLKPGEYMEHDPQVSLCRSELGMCIHGWGCIPQLAGTTA